jgi:hypothetical protein
MYDGAQSAQLTAEGLRLTGPRGFDYELEPNSCFVMLESTELAVRSSINWPIVEGPDEPATLLTAITAKCRPTQSRLFAFRKSAFLGQIKEISFHCVSGEREHSAAHVIEPKDNIVDELHLAISGILPEGHFREIFHPLWVRQAKSYLDINLYLQGFQFGPEGAFEEIGDTSNFVFDASQVQARFNSISLRTILSPLPPPVPR